MHRIHLRGFWDMDEPTAGRIRFTRRFGCPTTNRLQKLFLAVELTPAGLNISVNGELLQREENGNRFVLCSLSPRNLLAVEMDGDLQSHAPEVAIEIEE